MELLVTIDELVDETSALNTQSIDWFKGVLIRFCYVHFDTTLIMEQEIKNQDCLRAIERFCGYCVVVLK